MINRENQTGKMLNRVGVNLRASAYLHQGDRKYMEDEFQVAYQKTEDKKDIEYAYFGIFDGHGGKEAAHFAKDHLMDNIVQLRSFWSDNDEDVLSAIKEGFIHTHLQMWKMLDKWPRTASGWPSTSGTTASIAFIRRQKIYIGHVGDSGIVLGFEGDDGEWHGELLTTDHKPESAGEKARIKESGGKVVSKSGVPRVVWNRPKSGHLGPVRRSTPMDEIPFLAVARSLGDLWSYNANNNQFVVSPEPDVCVIDIDITKHRCLIFGTDGLWNVLSPTAAVNIAYFTEKNNEMHYLEDPSETGKQRLWINPSRSIVKSGALDRYMKTNLRADNTSAVTVFLDPPGPPKRDVLLNQNRKGQEQKGSAKPPLKEPNSEASIRVHVYNVDPNENGCRDGFHVKERIPDHWDNRDSGNPVTDSNYTPEEDASAPPVPPRTSSQTLPSKDMFFSDQYEENKDPIPCSSSAKCLECGCSSKDLEGSSNTLTKTSTDISVSDDIQSPVVSSSTSISQKKDVTIKCHTRASIKESKRRTRSCVPLVAGKNENTEEPSLQRSPSLWKGQNPFLKASSSSNNSFPKLRSGNLADSSNRILKSINGAPNVPSSLNGLATAAKTPTYKRKRSRDLLGSGEPDSKSLRVHTRSHTWSHKSIVTRSQDKIKKCKPK